jgi:hypothetical protein
MVQTSIRGTEDAFWADIGGMANFVGVLQMKETVVKIAARP